ncbi:YraN family protein [Clostridium botulinum]|uniref:UPF0102 protein ADU74_03080 n=1 Tax=Clostridium botulinum TaxID=1491 RepID=A0A9Q1ZFC2_CLOBO|nr:YraN family protein [Clostridium botulinum]AEB76141.1 Hypothetical UPF0102 protein [Clostridium botulinum BKT015925]KEH97794.1 hypothetical protein Z953_01480 [Clostridium botulinum D str. 16868]KEI05526.1 hypothetical protein Y848_07495 [Clostridium botulinum C/D str. Sp77]KLU76609.1 hypothetical protein CBC3_02845 [Clostridium botulinum V891]KOA75994.1 hypothetical protein ADU77_09800 [Clostridium botulinum]
MYNYNKAIGTFGETLSEKFLISKGHKILNKNFRCKLGEIDIISKFKNCICFTEVKTRYNNLYGIPCESVTHKKINKIKNTAKFYIAVNNTFDYEFNFNVIEILMNTNDNTYIINFIENAF